MTLKFLLFILFALVQAASGKEMEVNFLNEKLNLSGSLIFPESSGPHPAIVLLHGSGPSERSEYRVVAQHFANSGFASLIYDKRGTGKSEGSWMNSSIQELAQDASVAIQYLRTRPDVNHDCIGIWGVSQAGWIVPLVNAQTRFDFLIMVTGGGATPLDTEMYAYQMQWQRAGLTEKEKEEASNLLKQYFNYLKTGQGRTELLQAIEASKRNKWYSLMALDRILPSEENRKNWSWVAEFDPLPYVGKMKMPVLLLFGGRDLQTPTEVAAKRWEEGLTRAGNKEFTIRVFPEAAHAMTTGAHTAASHGSFVPNYFETMQGWLRDHVCRARQRR